MALTKLNFTGQPTLPVTIFPTGSVIQTIQGGGDTRYSLTSTAWQDTGLVSLTFPNTLQSNSKVLVRIYALLGEVAHGSWASYTALTIFENSNNKGNSTYGIVNSSAHAQNHVNTVYMAERMSGELLFTPTVNNGTYTLRAKAPNTYARTIGGTADSSSGNFPVGNTQVVLQEIAG